MFVLLFVGAYFIVLALRGCVPACMHACVCVCCFVVCWVGVRRYVLDE